MKKLKIFTLLFSLMLFFTGCGTVVTTENENATAPTLTTSPEDNLKSNESIKVVEIPSETFDSWLKVHFIDVDQGDATLIESNGHFMLIDAGENNQANVVISYLKEVGVQKLDYVIGTHPHSDHIGGLDKVIDTFEILEVILPEKEHTTKTFEDVLDSISNKGLAITKPVVSQMYEIGDATFTILAPNKDYGDDLNNWSIGIKLTYIDTNFIFTGDAESAEEDICNNGIDLTADVFYAGHHGSSTSNSQEILDAIRPNYIIISCGKENSYGHPHQETLDRIETLGITSFRTDLDGTIVALSNGTNISWNTKNNNAVNHTETVTPTPTITLTPTATETPSPTPTATPVTEQEDNKSIIVHITKTGEKYHSSGCQYLRQSDIEISLKDAKARGYSACSKCKPPQ